MRRSGPTLSPQELTQMLANWSFDQHGGRDTCAAFDPYPDGDCRTCFHSEAHHAICSLVHSHEQLRAQLTEAEARLASQQVELTDWILVADSVKHDWRCDHGARGGPVCLRCRLELAEARLASQGEQSYALLTSWAECRARLREALTARDEAEGRILAEVAKLPNPVVSTSANTKGETLHCRWCGQSWLRLREKSTNDHHPDNDCLWPRAQAAMLQPSDPSADPPKEQA